MGSSTERARMGAEPPRPFRGPLACPWFSLRSLPSPPPLQNHRNADAARIPQTTRLTSMTILRMFSRGWGRRLRTTLPPPMGVYDASIPDGHAGSLIGDYHIICTGSTRVNDGNSISLANQEFGRRGIWHGRRLDRHVAVRRISTTRDSAILIFPYLRLVVQPLATSAITGLRRVCERECCGNDGTTREESCEPKNRTCSCIIATLRVGGSQVKVS